MRQAVLGKLHTRSPCPRSLARARGHWAHRPLRIVFSRSHPRARGSQPLGAPPPLRIVFSRSHPRARGSQTLGAPPCAPTDRFLPRSGGEGEPNIGRTAAPTDRFLPLPCQGEGEPNIGRTAVRPYGSFSPAPIPGRGGGGTGCSCSLRSSTRII
jgi:hypothetical protein